VFLIIVIGIAANKSDLIEEEKVSEEEVKQFAQEKGIIFGLISACNGYGVTNLFNELGLKYVEQNEEILNQSQDNSIELTDKKSKKKKCCNSKK
jgi:GTPase involved in cell partitioning and DNA repair